MDAEFDGHEKRAAREVSPWRSRVSAKVNRSVGMDSLAGHVATMFGLSGEHVEVLYDGLEVCIEPGQIVVVTGPSGAGKSVLLRQVAGNVENVVWLDTARWDGISTPAVSALPCGSPAQRLEAMSLCGLAEAAVMVTPAGRLSGGQAYRLALAAAILEAGQAGRPMLVVTDEFAATLDDDSAAALCLAMRKLIGSPGGAGLALLVGTARQDLLKNLKPDQVIFKPLGGPVEYYRSRQATPRLSPRRQGGDPYRWRITRGTLLDYYSLAAFHYLAGPPATHKRVYVIHPPGGASGLAGRYCPPAAVLVVSPPLPCVRGRNIATDGRYSTTDRTRSLALLNAEVEAISRVVVHPVYRGLGLAGRLIRHALAKAQTPVVEALAVMGRIHPLFDRAGMASYHVPAPAYRPYVYYLWIAPRGHRSYRYPPDIAKRRLPRITSGRSTKG